MRRVRIVLALAVAALVSSALPAGAITNGIPDGEDHPYVGMLVFQRPGGVAARCSGTLLDPTVVLTAAHCTEGALSTRVYFASTVTDTSTGFVTGTAFTHPEWTDLFLPDSHDIGVVVLDEPVVMDTYGRLPKAGLVDTLPKRKGRHSQLFTVAGYGLQQVKPKLVRLLTRYQAQVTIINMHNATVDDFYIQISGNSNAIWSGGTCFGDSGGPMFLDDTNVVIAVTSAGTDPNCKSGGYQYRTDIADTRDFLDDFIPVP